MLKLSLRTVNDGMIMVKNKRDLMKSPRRRSLARTGTRNKIATSGGADICVVVRARPLNDKEKGENSRKIIKIVGEDLLIFDPKEDDEPFFYHGVQQKGRDLLKKSNKNLQFHFDHVFGFDSENADVFEKSTKSLIQTLMDGYNCSVFAYGATGAGKTFTMLGKPENPGITVLTMSELFKRKDELSSERDFELGITYLEVYNENVQDLLNPGPPLHLREDGKFGVVVAGIQIKKIENCQELFDLLDQGNRNRTQHPTDANAESSRSHAVFQVYLRMTIKASCEVRIAKLSMIDLAGSERGSATGFCGARFTEGANINKSLLALGNCINSLADGQRHIPYRDSKLTRLLKDSLGGNCRTVMIANVSPSSLNYEDTYNTLKYATRAKKIKLKLKKNVVASSLNINHYIKQNEALQNDIRTLKEENEKLRSENENLKLRITGVCTCEQGDAVTDASPSEKESSSPVSVPPVTNQFSELKTRLVELYNEKKKLEEKIASYNNLKRLFSIRKNIKECTDARLSGLCTESSEKKEGHRRIGTTMENLNRQIECIDKELNQLEDQLEKINTEINSLSIPEDNLELKEYLRLLQTEIDNIREKSEVDYLKKQNDILNGELRLRGELIERMSAVLKPCFLQLRGHGFATNDMIKSYLDLVRYFQGLKNVTWKEDDNSSVDSGISSTTVTGDMEENTKTPIKRRLLDEDDLNGMNDTFVVAPTTLHKGKKNTETMATRGKKPATEKKVVKSHPPKLIRITKENRDPVIKKAELNKASQIKSPGTFARKYGYIPGSTSKILSKTGK